MPDLETGELRPQRCKANWCPYCSQVKTRQIARAVGASDPTALVTFTQVGDSWKVIQRRMNKMIEHLRAGGYRFEWVWKVECNTNRQHQHHVHAYVHGDALPEDFAFQAAAQRVGFGQQTDYIALSAPTDNAPRYLWGKKPYELHITRLDHHLRINGDRLHHASRGFWRDGGEPVGGGMPGLLRIINERQRSSRTARPASAVAATGAVRGDVSTPPVEVGRTDGSHDA